MAIIEDQVFEELIGKTLTAIKVDEKYAAWILFVVSEDEKYLLHNDEADCNDVQVTIDDINGDINDLVGSPLTMAESVSNEAFEKTQDAEGTWTFYRFATIKGYVDIRWFGTFNGYYSETVTLERL